MTTDQPATPPRQLTETDLITAGHHPAVAQILRWFVSGHLPEPLRVISAACEQLAIDMADALPDGGPELTTGLRKLLEAKDCFVRAGIASREANR